MFDEGIYETIGGGEEPVEPLRGGTDHVRRHSVTDLRLAGAIEVALAATELDADGVARPFEARIAFPDEVRSLLETTSWDDRATVVDVLRAAALACLARVDADGASARSLGSIIPRRRRARRLFAGSVDDVRGALAEVAVTRAPSRLRPAVRA